jgi:hypothetical protein
MMRAKVYRPQRKWVKRHAYRRFHCSHDEPSLFGGVICADGMLDYFLRVVSRSPQKEKILEQKLYS